MEHPAINKLVIEPELASLLDPLTPPEREGLYQQLEKEGVRDPLSYAWIDGSPILLDGHNRFKWWIEFARVSLGKPRLRCVDSVTCLTSAKLWMHDYQRGRRNLSKKQKARLNGLRLRWQFELEALNAPRKKALHGELVRKQAAKEEQSVRQVQYDEAYSKAIEEIEFVDPKSANAIETGRYPITQKDVIKMVKDKKVNEGLNNLKAGKKWDDICEAATLTEKTEIKFQQARATWNLLNRSLVTLLDRIQLMEVLTKGGFPLKDTTESVETIRETLANWEPLAMCECEGAGCDQCKEIGWQTRPSVVI
tara:strand:- start:1289 stop:2212 length:924 start_codon:yes stop_codon:yes gene_type:complete